MIGNPLTTIGVNGSLFKSTLFLLTGGIDHQAGTRDIRNLLEVVEEVI